MEQYILKRKMRSEDQSLLKMSSKQGYEGLSQGNSIQRANLKILFEILMIESEKRSLGDIKSIKQILSDLQSMKKIQNTTEYQYICRELALIRLKNGEFLFHRNKAKLYIVLQGRIGIYNKQKNHLDLDQVQILGPSDCFGQLIENSISKQLQNYVALTLEDSILAVITVDSYKKFEELESTQLGLIQQYINDFKLFSKLTQEQKKSLVKLSSLVKVPANTVLIKQGEILKALYLIRKGIIKVFKCLKYTLENAQGGLSFVNKTFQVVELGGGDSFSIAYLKQKSQVSVTIVTSCPCEMVLIPYKDIDRYLDRIQDQEKIIFQDKDIRQNYAMICKWKEYKQGYIQLLQNEAQNRRIINKHRQPLKPKHKAKLN